MSGIEETLEGVDVEIEVVLGDTRMPVHQLLRMGRGAVIELNATEADDVLVLANDVLVAKAGIVVNDGRIGISITKLFRRPSSEGGTTGVEEVAQKAIDDSAPQAAETAPA
jgi:flagellar motor switch protein FliN/FliY